MLCWLRRHDWINPFHLNGLNGRISLLDFWTHTNFQSNLSCSYQNRRHFLIACICRKVCYPHKKSVNAMIPNLLLPVFCKKKRKKKGALSVPALNCKRALPREWGAMEKMKRPNIRHFVANSGFDAVFQCNAWFKIKRWKDTPPLR